MVHAHWVNPRGDSVNAGRKKRDALEANHLTKNQNSLCTIAWRQNQEGFLGRACYAMSEVIGPLSSFHDKRRIDPEDLLITTPEGHV
ncbi:MAG: hypothetical protein KJ061_09635 [Vicinamibacteraceae bacterium]|nr:hypothetical protein [Vicinamibacteraceae bacterium]